VMDISVDELLDMRKKKGKKELTYSNG
jgi:hypothetical protein